MTTETPNIRLTEIDAGRRNWSATMNQNLVLIDAVIGAYFSVQDLQGVWQNSTAYTLNQTVVDETSSVVYKCLVAHTSAAVPTTFAEDRAAHTTYWGVYSSPARSRGAWLPSTSYALNDFVVSGSQYAICIQTHTSGATFAADLALAKWSVLVDLSSVGSAVLPVPGGAADANKFTVLNALGTGYTIVSAANALTLLGGTTIGLGVFQATTEAAARAAINAQVAGSYQPVGSYQPLDAALTSLSGITVGAYGITLVGMTTLTAFKTALGGLGTAAPLDVGTTASKVVQLDGSAKLPAVDGSALTNLTIALTKITASLGADVNMNNTALYFTGPSIAQGATGTWFVSGTVSVGGAGVNQGDVFNVRLWDGTTVIASTQVTYEGPGGSQVKSASLSGYLVNPVGDIRISVNSATRTNLILFNASGNSMDSTISAFRIA